MPHLTGAESSLLHAATGEVLTVSIGLCSLNPDASLTDREAQERANRAKNHAKEAGRDRIASYRGSLYSDDELEVVSGD